MLIQPLGIDSIGTNLTGTVKKLHARLCRVVGQAVAILGAIEHAILRGGPLWCRVTGHANGGKP